MRIGLVAVAIGKSRRTARSGLIGAIRRAGGINWRGGESEEIASREDSLTLILSHDGADE